MARLARYLVVWLAVLAVAAALAPLREIDWWLLGKLNHGAAPPWHRSVVLVDLPDRPAEQREAFRGDVAALLNSLLADPAARPKTVVLDIAFAAQTPIPAALTDALKAARQAKVPVYAAVNPFGFDKDLTPKYLDAHAKTLYQEHFEGMGHTVFDLAGTTLRYRPVLDVGETDSEPKMSISVEALVFKVAQEQFDGVLVRDREWLVMNVGARDEYQRHLVRFVPAAAGGGAFQAYLPGAAGQPVAQPDVAGKAVIVGSFGSDISRFEKRPGPELVAWALNERLAPRDAYAAPNVITSPGVLAAMVLATSALAAGLFYVLFRALPAQRSRLWLLGPVSALAALGLLVAAVLALRSLGDLYAQVSLPLIGIVVATTLMWRSWRRRLAEDALSADLERRRSAAASEYDIFISYSREAENKAWVTRHVYEPLKAARRADGSELRIFFDTESIPVGVTWYETLAEAINNSRFFLPVYSVDYFKKDFCKFEITQAAIRRAGQGDFIMPVARVMSGIPPGYQQINAFDITLHPDFIEKILAVVLVAKADE